ncbi:MAG: hypothetical protein KC483_00530 [Nitrosarchaeum sp.]|nr:hypothetical protein [Nitrosarchaeum sp.]MCA9819293.1 hypothetical protein [Nitrosarchaeum sp.]
MNKAVMALAAVVVLAAVFAIASPVDVAVAQTSDAMPDGEEQYKDGEHEGKSCPNKERKAQESSL